MVQGKARGTWGHMDPSSTTVGLYKALGTAFLGFFIYKMELTH